MKHLQKHKVVMSKKRSKNMHERKSSVQRKRNSKKQLSKLLTKKREKIINLVLNCAVFAADYCLFYYQCFNFFLSLSLSCRIIAKIYKLKAIGKQSHFIVAIHKSLL